MWPKDMFSSGSPAPVTIIMIQARKKTWDKQFLTVCPAPSESWGEIGSLLGSSASRAMPTRSVSAGDKSGRRMGWGVYFAGEVKASLVHSVGFHPASMRLSSIPIGLLFRIGTGFQHYLFVDLISLSVSPYFLSSSPKAKQQGTLDLFLSKPGGYVP